MDSLIKTRVRNKCEHNRIRSSCKECGGVSICEHNRIRQTCKDCGGVSICEHNRRRSACKDCGGASICEHNTQRSHCIECHGCAICEHNTRRDRCKECKGSGICEHNRRKERCPDCSGSDICKSKNEPYNTGCRTHGNRKLNGFCAHCFVNIFPQDPRVESIFKKSKEIKVVSHILSKFDNFIHDKPFYVDLEGGCCATKRRIDLRQ